MAAAYHQLGRVAQARGDLDTAQDWYRKSLAISEELGNRPYMASTYHQLGMVAQERGDLDTAQDWYRKSLAISEELGDWPGMALTYGQSGLLAEQRGQLAEALAWMVRCISLFDKIPHLSTGSGPWHLARLTSQLGTAALEDAWQAVTGGGLPEAVRDYVAGRIQEKTEPS